MEKNAKSMLEMAMNKLQLSARSYHRLIKVARTIADLDNSELILSHHMAETLTYRQESALPIPNH
jgi:magnesium chelatase family protein